MPQPNEQITALPLRIDGVDDQDPEGWIPLEQLTNGTIGRIPRWADFPDTTGQYTDLFVYWAQPNDREIYQRRYLPADDRPEFTFPISPQDMSVDGIAYIHYLLIKHDGNKDPSPKRKLTIDHTPAPTLTAPKFPDSNLWGYLNCSSPVPIWEKVRVEILPESIFRGQDECVLQWQGFDTLNGSPPALTPVYEFRKTLSDSEAINGFIMEIPFVPYVRPMVDSDSGVAQYTIYRNGIPKGRSGKGLVKIDRIIPGEEQPCGGFA
ncbi:hypothetical protein FBY06_1176 [Pseudomonas sp. SJZ085]|nr:hypothetical protein FBX99_117110 [Pseudomonas sp. SJZ074]TWC19744.1 hypothetical protein FBY00_105113 [Pseudomonas sp. SJZ075]TWC35356.1 hypothetical protein FBY02_105124 [Pseudomonas sp. SJZ078]TWC35474.1 hypothetical protein FBY06_1176 [Pseudomonas sp. SJZ085]TWC56302.1 hypothetical protein FBY11_105124 [Pseudomonas sp. SJZ124]TWC91746.1 hypothetical protein FBY09_105113 [Pseudomonas sp. SJZ101]